jgi:hypothetical protein
MISPSDMNRMKRILFFCSFIALTRLACAQDLTLSPAEIEWNEGTIMLNDETEIKGLLKYNDKTGVLSFENGSDSRSFTARSVRRFTFFDNIAAQNRQFYSVNYNDPKDGRDRPGFFEVLREFKTFALLSKSDPVEIKQKGSAFYNTMYSTGAVGTGQNYRRIVVSQNETLYIFDAEGNISPYMKFTTEEIESTFLFDDGHSNRKKVLDYNLIEAYTQPHYETLKQFAKENKLSFRKKAELLQILDRYQELVNP